MAIRDLREWIGKLKEERELAVVEAPVDWNLEIGGILRENVDRDGSALLFENIKDYEDTICTKLFVASLSTYSRISTLETTNISTFPAPCVISV